MCTQFSTAARGGICLDDPKNDLPEQSEADKQRAEMAAAKDKARAEMQRQNRGKSKELHRKYAGR